MKLDTIKFGKVEVDDSLIFNFLDPILGYEHIEKYVLIDYNQDSPFKWLQAIDEASISFPVTIPALFGIDYTFVVPEKQVKALGLESIDDILTLNVVNIPSGHPELSTINLLGPIVINVKNKNASQMIIQDDKYSVRHKLFKDGEISSLV